MIDSIIKRTRKLSVTFYTLKILCVWDGTAFEGFMGFPYETIWACCFVWGNSLITFSIPFLLSKNVSLSKIFFQTYWNTVQISQTAWSYFCKSVRTPWRVETINSANALLVRTHALSMSYFWICLIVNLNYKIEYI